MSCGVEVMVVVAVEVAEVAVVMREIVRGGGGGAA